MKYKNRIRSRYSNLKDTKNPKLRQMVLTGDIKPEKIAVMTAEVRGRTTGMEGDLKKKIIYIFSVLSITVYFMVNDPHPMLKKVKADSRFAPS